MSETTNPTAEGAASQESTGLNTQSNEFEVLAATQLSNPDLHVPVVDLMFDGQTKRAKLLKPEVLTADGSGGLAFKPLFEMLEELVSVEGIKKAPGFVFRPRPYVIVEASKQPTMKTEISQRELNKLQIAAGIWKRTDQPSQRQIVAAMGQLEGKEVLVKFTAKASTKSDPATGQPYVNQNLSFAAPGSVKEAVGGQY